MCYDINSCNLPIFLTFDRKLAILGSFLHNYDMQKSTELIIDNHLNEHIIRECDLAFLFGGTAARRYALVNKAVKKGELIRLCRGYYTLNHKYQKENTLSPFYVANRIMPYSYISLESALSFHHLIPERVTQTISIAAFGRNKKFETPYGEFIYYVPPIPARYFYFGVEMFEENNQIIYITTPLRALMDYVYYRKIENANCDFLINSLRIEEEDIVEKITFSEITVLKTLYQSRYISHFLKNLTHELHYV